MSRREGWNAPDRQDDAAELDHERYDVAEPARFLKAFTRGRTAASVLRVSSSAPEQMAITSARYAWRVAHNVLTRQPCT